MDPAALVLFATALLIAVASPGPGITALVARVLGRGLDGVVAFAAGLILGDLLWLTVAILGLAVIAQTFHGVFIMIKYAGAAYLLWLAYKLWTSPVQARTIETEVPKERRFRSFLGGLAVTLGNPKVMTFYLALLPSLLDLSQVNTIGYAELCGIVVATLSLVFACYIGLAERARTMLRSARALQFVNRGSGALMAGAAVTIASR
ncbi:MAG TPA: LysE family translocator [Xanthobacteraceae bacterium]|jgi:threonine/homoserine/homoserine lactone efflux protein|nr:LysE family translocator [Xanthobacteraceae bacterium]